MTRAHRRDQVEQMARRDGAHQTEAERGSLQPDEILRLTLGALHVAVGLIEERLDLLTQLGEVRVGTFAVEQGAAQLRFERLDGARERGLRNFAALGRAREVQLLAQREKIANLMQFHGRHSLGDNRLWGGATCEMPSSYRLDSEIVWLVHSMRSDAQAYWERGRTRSIRVSECLAFRRIARRC